MGSYLGFQMLNPLFGGTYADKVMGTKPIAYWPLWEPSGATAYDQILSAQNGTYALVTLGQTGIGDGRTSVLFPGAGNAYMNPYTATLAGRFSGSSGSCFCWAKVANSAVWTDGTARYFFQWQVDGNNFFTFGRFTTNTQVQIRAKCAGTFQTGQYNTSSPTSFFSCGITWSWGGANTVVTGYINGTAVGAAVTVANQYVGSLTNTQAVVGAGGLLGSQVWSGYLAHVSLWNRVLTLTEISNLAKLS